jgi:Domain of unknown function (DUF4157)
MARLYARRPDSGSGLSGSQEQGEALPTSVRRHFEPLFGYDFRQVRLKRGSRNSELASKIDARAYTVRNSIVFRKGEYSPDTMAGRKLLAHELTHVVQQGGAQPLAARRSARFLRATESRTGSAVGNTAVARRVAHITGRTSRMAQRKCDPQKCQSLRAAKSPIQSWIKVLSDKSAAVTSGSIYWKSTGKNTSSIAVEDRRQYSPGKKPKTKVEFQVEPCPLVKGGNCRRGLFPSKGYFPRNWVSFKKPANRPVDQPISVEILLVRGTATLSSFKKFLCLCG